MSEQSEPNTIDYIKILKACVFDVVLNQNNSPLIDNYRLLSNRLLILFKSVLPLKRIVVFERSKT